MSKTNVLIPLARGFEETEAVTIIDLLRRAGIEVDTAAVEGGKTVKGAHSISVQTDHELDDVRNRDYSAIILPGGMPGSTHLAESKTLKKMLEQQKQKGHWLGAICAAPTVLAAHGLLEGKAATCYPGFEKQLTGANHRDDQVVVDGKFITSRGPGTAIPFALMIIEKLAGKEKAESVGKAVLYL